MRNHLVHLVDLGASWSVFVIYGVRYPLMELVLASGFKIFLMGSVHGPCHVPCGFYVRLDI